MNKNPALVKHILDAIQDIMDFMEGKDFVHFKNDKLLKNAVLREFIVIGEASANLSESFREKHADIPFYKIIGMRNTMVHAYWQINDEIVWDAYKNNLPELKKKLEKIV